MLVLILKLNLKHFRLKHNQHKKRKKIRKVHISELLHFNLTQPILAFTYFCFINKFDVSPLETFFWSSLIKANKECSFRLVKPSFLIKKFKKNFYFTWELGLSMSYKLTIRNRKKKAI